MDLRILRLLKKTYPLRKIDIGELGRDHYFSSQGKGFIFEHIQPVIDVRAVLLKPIGVTEQKIIVGGVARINIVPPKGHGWEILFITASTDEAAGKTVTLRLLTNTPPPAGMDMALSSSILGPAETIVWPSMHDLTGQEHDHRIGVFPLIAYNPELLPGVTIAGTNGKILRIKYIYRRVL